MDLDGSGRAEQQFVPLVPPHDIRRVRGLFADIEGDRTAYPQSDDYIEVELLDRGIILDVFNKLKAHHTFTYSLVGHVGALDVVQTRENAELLNQGAGCCKR